MTSRLWSPTRSAWLSATIVSTVMVALATPGVAAIVDPAAPSLTGTVTSFGPTVLGPSGGIVTTVEVASAAMEQADGLGLTLTLTDAPLRTSEEIAAFLESPGAYPSHSVAERELPAVSTSQTARTSLTASASELDLPADTWGVYGLSVVLTGAGEPLTVDAMVLTWADATVPSLPLAVVTTASGSDARVGSLLSAAAHPSVTLLVDPLAVQRVDGAAAEVSSREAYRVPAGNPDLASLAHGQGEAILEFALAQSATAVPRSLQGLPWVGVVPVLDEPTLQLAHDYGAVATLVEPRFGASPPAADDADGGLPPAITDVTLETSGDTIAMLVPNAGLSTLVAQYRPHHPAAPARLVAETALVAAQGDGTQPVIVSTGSSWMVDGTRPSPVIAAMFDAPWVTSISLASVLSDARRGVAQVSGTELAETELDALVVDGIAVRLARLQHLAAATDDPSAVLVAPSAALLNAASLDSRANQEDRESAVQGVFESVDLMLESVSITSGSALNLVAAAGDVPVTIRNDLDVAATVTVRMTANSPNIRITDSPVVTIPPQSEVTAMVPVTAVSSANVTVRLSLRNADNEIVGSPRALDIRVRADWGNAATAVFTVALVILLVAGLIRTVRRGRKDTRTGPGEVAALAEPRSRELRHD